MVPSWCRPSRRQGSRAVPGPRALRYRPRLEALEGRRLLSADPPLTGLTTGLLVFLKDRQIILPVALFHTADPTPLHAAVDWGAGDPSPGTLIPGGGDAYAVMASHTYHAAGTFQVTVTLLVEDQPVASVTATARVLDLNQPFLDSTPGLVIGIFPGGGSGGGSGNSGNGGGGNSNSEVPSGGTPNPPPVNSPPPVTGPPPAGAPQAGPGAGGIPSTPGTRPPPPVISVTPPGSPGDVPWRRTPDHDAPRPEVLAGLRAQPGPYAAGSVAVGARPADAPAAAPVQIFSQPVPGTNYRIAISVRPAPVTLVTSTAPDPPAGGGRPTEGEASEPYLAAAEPLPAPRLVAVADVPPAVTDDYFARLQFLQEAGQSHGVLTCADSGPSPDGSEEVALVGDRPEAPRWSRRLGMACLLVQSLALVAWELDEGRSRAGRTRPG
jgi:hypothetical protein